MKFLTRKILMLVIMLMSQLASAQVMPNVVADWRMDEIAWTGASGEVTDSSGNNLSGVARGMTTTSGYICNAGDFSDTGTSDFLDMDRQALNGRSDFSISVWVQTTDGGSQTIVSGSTGSQHNETIMFLPNANTFQPFLKGSSSGGNISVSVNDGNWHHLVWTRSGSQNCLFLDGVQQGSCVTRSSTALVIASGGLIIGQEQDALGGGFDVGQAWDGLLDELIVFDGAMTPAQVNQVYSNQLAGNNWDGSARTCPVVTAPAVEYQMEEPAWNATVGEVVDSSANVYSATAFNGAQTRETTPAISGSPGTCLYAEFDGVDDYIELPNSFPNLTGSFTVTAWINADDLNQGSRIFLDDENNSRGFGFSLGDGGAGRLRFFSRNVNPIIVDTRNAEITTGRWYFVAAVHDAAGRTRQIYIDGVAATLDNNSTISTYTGTWGSDAGPASIGGETNNSGERGAAFHFNGSIDEVRVFQSAISAAEINRIMNETRPCQLTPRAEWRFDESAWSGTAGEVLDSSGNNFHGTASDSTTDTGLICKAGDFSATGTSDFLSLDAQALNGLGDFSFSVWVKTADTGSQTIVSGANSSENNEAILFFSNATTFSPHLKGSSSGGNVSVSINDDNWHHLVWTRSGSQNCLFVDAVQQGCVSRPTAVLNIDNGGFIIAQEQDAVGGGFVASQAWDGLLDELILFDDALSVAQISEIYNHQLAGNNWDGSPRSCPAYGPDHFRIEHSGSGATCAAVPVTISARLANGDLDTGFTGTVNFSSSTNHGDWFGGATPSGTDSGAASYTFVSGDNGQVILDYKNTHLETVNLNVTDGSVTENSGSAVAGDDPDLVITDSALLFSSVPTQIAGQDSATVTLQAVRASDSDPAVCEPAFASGSTVAIELAAECNNPSRCISGQVFSVTNNTTTTALPLVDDNGGAGASTYQLVNVLFGANSSADLIINYSDVGQMQLHGQYNIPFDDNSANLSGVYMRGSSNAFVVKPHSLGIGLTSNPAAENENEPFFHAAGENFPVSVVALNANGVATPNYGNEINPESIALSHTLVAPGSGSAGVLSGSLSLSTIDPGTFTGTYNWSEVGIISLTASVADNDYLGGNDVQTTLDYVGRFIPASFSVVAGSLTNRIDRSCITPSAFTYMDETLGVDLTITAQNLAGDKTDNYEGVFAKLDSFNELRHGAVNGGVDLSTRVIDDATAITWNQGASNFSLRVQFSREAAGLVDGPFAALQLGIAPQDEDGVSMQASDLNLDVNSDSSNDHFEIGTSDIRYGRLNVENAYGPETRTLPVPVIAEYFNGAYFVTNGDDSCTALNPADFDLASASSSNPAPGILNGVEVGGGSSNGAIANTPFMFGDAGFDLSAPGVNNTGPVYIDVSAPSWLQFDWNGSGVPLQNPPTATATFGSHRGHDRIIFRREINQ